MASSSTPSRALSLDLPHSMRDHWFFSPIYSQHSLARALHSVGSQQYCLSIRGPSVLQACTHSGGRAGGNDASMRSSTPTVHFAQAASLLRRPVHSEPCVKVLTGTSSGGLGERVRLSRSALRSLPFRTEHTCAYKCPSFLSCDKMSAPMRTINNPATRAPLQLHAIANPEAAEAGKRAAGHAAVAYLSHEGGLIAHPPGAGRCSCRSARRPTCAAPVCAQCVPMLARRPRE